MDEIRILIKLKDVTLLLSQYHYKCSFIFKHDPCNFH